MSIEASPVSGLPGMKGVSHPVLSTGAPAVPSSTVDRTVIPRPPATALRAPTVVVFDSGLGGLSVLRELVRTQTDARFIYAADDAGFPYGGWKEDELVARVVGVMDALIARLMPDAVVIACNTASTLVLPALRTRHSIPFIGTVPAIKPACEGSVSRQVSVLATPGTVRRDYTQALIRDFAGDCRVNLVGSTGLATLAETAMAGGHVADDDFAAEIEPAFVREGRARTDTVVLACTHYPLVLDRLRKVAPWPVRWVDPAPAIARRLSSLIGPPAFAPSSSPMRLFSTGSPLDSCLIEQTVGRAARAGELLPAALSA